MSFITPQAGHALAQLQEVYPGLRAGIYNRRKIANSTKWSQHSWPNALDLFFTNYGDTSPEHQAQLNHVYAYLKAKEDELQIRVLLWKVARHYDHIHVDFWPKGYATPSKTRGGSDNLYETRDGRIISQKTLLEEAVTNDFEYKVPEDLTDDEQEVFYKAWQWAEEAGIVNQHTEPVDIVEKQEMITFLKRYHDRFGTADQAELPDVIDLSDYELIRKEV